MRRILLGLGLAIAVCAQPHFDVATMKRNTSGAERASMTGGPLPSGPFNLSGNDPARITWTNIGLRRMVQVAYDMPVDRISAPDWFDSEHYDVSATMAAGTSVAGFRLMVQGLLAERLKLTLHRATKDVSGYALEIAKGGPKLAEAKHEVAAIDPKMDQGCRGCNALVVMDRSGYPAPRPGNPYYGPDASFQATIVVGSRYRAAALNAPMTGIATFLANFVGSPVADRTGLKGVYDARIEFVPPPSDPAADPDPGPTLMDAVQSQLGLKLTSAKVPVETLVVDHAEKIPTEN
ncbi:MAG TPA: TIGR03435 family protein [Bryobacteraceae bacterium]|jgi:uncharacterized protein (TIGR03435 family)